MKHAAETYFRFDLGLNHDVYQNLHTGSVCKYGNFSGSDFECKLLRLSYRNAFGSALPGTAHPWVTAYFSDPIALACTDARSQVASASRPRDRNPEPGDGSCRRLTLVRDHTPVRPTVPRGEFNSLSAHWVLQYLQRGLTQKRSPRAVLNGALNELSRFKAEQKSLTPYLGVRLSACGRLGKRKKGMAQTLVRGLGKVPHGSFKHKVELSQGFVTTALGTVGLKVWICYA